MGRCGGGGGGGCTGYCPCRPCSLFQSANDTIGSTFECIFSLAEALRSIFRTLIYISLVTLLSFTMPSYGGKVMVHREVGELKLVVEKLTKDLALAERAFQEAEYGICMLCHQVGSSCETSRMLGTGGSRSCRNAKYKGGTINNNPGNVNKQLHNSISSTLQEDQEKYVPNEMKLEGYGKPPNFEHDNIQTIYTDPKESLYTTSVTIKPVKSRSLNAASKSQVPLTANSQHGASTTRNKDNSLDGESKTRTPLTHSPNDASKIRAPLTVNSLNVESKSGASVKDNFPGVATEKTVNRQLS